LKRALGFYLALVSAVALWAAAPAPKPKLRFVVIFSRHGVRSPTWEAARLNQYSAEPWPSWGVAPGDLTPHGRQLMKFMGTYYRNWLSDEHLIDSQGCADAARIYIWADTAERTLESGRALAESILPGCGVQIHSQPPGTTDPIFSGSGATADRASRQETGPDATTLIAEHRAAFEALQSVLGHGALGPLPANALRRADDPPQAANQEAAESFDTGSSLSEDLLLEYANGMQGAQLGWGRLTQQNLLQALELHAVYTDLTRRAPSVARLRGANLLNVLLLSLGQAVSGKQITGAVGAADDSVLILVGHDTNQSNISGILDLQWSLPGYQPNDTPPGGALIFSLWQSQTTRQFFVKTQYIAQTLDQMRDGTPLSLAAPPANQDISVQGCEKAAGNSSGCSWDSFRAVVQRTLNTPESSEPAKGLP
jgi:4-phytase/acid phosphatase